MRLMYWGKDGGPESRVWGFWPIEVKSLFSVALLQFRHGSREAFHSHAFNSVSWVLWGRLVEENMDGTVNFYYMDWIHPVVTKRNTFHKVSCDRSTWVLTFRGPWSKTWQEYLPQQDKFVTLTHGRQEVA